MNDPSACEQYSQLSPVQQSEQTDARCQADTSNNRIRTNLSRAALCSRIHAEVLFYNGSGVQKAKPLTKLACTMI